MLGRRAYKRGCRDGYRAGYARAIADLERDARGIIQAEYARLIDETAGRSWLHHARQLMLSRAGLQ